MRRPAGFQSLAEFDAVFCVEPVIATPAGSSAAPWTAGPALPLDLHRGRPPVRRGCLAGHPLRGWYALFGVEVEVYAMQGAGHFWPDPVFPVNDARATFLLRRHR